MKIKTTFTIAAILLAAAQFACAATVTLTPLNVFLNKPVGLGYNSVSSSLIISINYDNGLPNQFAQLPASGVPSQFSNASGWSHGEEITHTIIPTALVGFQTGDVYAPNGEPGGIGRIRADGTEERFWTTLVDGQNTESGSVRSFQQIRIFSLPISAQTGCSPPRPASSLPWLERSLLHRRAWQSSFT